MKYIKPVLVLAFCIFSTNIIVAQQQQNITIINPSNADFKNAVVEIPWEKIIKKYPSIDTANFKVVFTKGKKEIPCQLEYKGQKQVQNLLVQVSIAPKQKIELQLVQGKSMVIQPKTFARYVPERKDDFAWENDKIAFRMYGKALEKTPKEMAYGIDVWVKRTDRLIINERYKRGEYHVDHGDGLDYYHVGLTLGAGNIMPIINDSIYYSANYNSYSIVDNGPLRTTFQLYYDEWLVNAIKTRAVKTISLDAGSQLNKITVAYEAQQSLTAVAGIILREKASIKHFDEQNGILAYWEPNDAKNGTTGVACIFLNENVPMKELQKQLIALPTSIEHNTFSYFAGAAWNKAGEIANMQDWLQYLNEFKKKVQHPLTIK